MRLHRPVLAGLVLGTLLPVTAASAATGVAAAGSATSTATLASLSVGTLTAGVTTIQGHTISIGTLSANAQTLSATQAPAVTFTPLTVDGIGTAATTVTPANSPKTVGGVTTAALPLNVLSATSPSATLTAASGAARTASISTQLGQAKVLGLPITLNGSLNVGSLTDASQSQASKSLSITNVSLPNLADLLAALGIDLTSLPATTLNALITELDMTLSSTAAAALDAANTAVDAAVGPESATHDAYNAAVAALDSAAAALDAQLAATDLSTVTLPSTIAAPVDHNDWDALTAMGPTGTAVQTAIEVVNPQVTAAAAAYESAKPAVQPAFDAWNTALDTLNAALQQLAGVVDGVLSGTPLVSIGAAQVGTNAHVGSTKAATVTGYVSGVSVLGTDVLKAVTGNSKVDAAALVGSVADEVNAALADLSSTLSSVLSSVTGATGLVVPAPTIEVLKKTTTTGVSGAFGTANATVTALSVSLGSATIPAVYALDDAASLAGIAATATGFKTAPMSVKVGVLGEAAQFRPANSTSGPGGSGSMPSTGAPAGLAIVAVIGAALAVGVRRRLRTTD